MARNSKVTKAKGDGRRNKRDSATGRPRRGRPKFCIFCREHATWVDYKDVGLLGRFLSDRGRIKARATTGTCAQHQREVATAIKCAREMALLPYAVRLAQTERRGGRGGGRPRGGPTAADARGPSDAEPTSPGAEADGAEEAAVGADGRSVNAPV